MSEIFSMIYINHKSYHSCNFLEAMNYCFSFQSFQSFHSSQNWPLFNQLIITYFSYAFIFIVTKTLRRLYQCSARYKTYLASDRIGDKKNEWRSELFSLLFRRLIQLKTNMNAFHLPKPSTTALILSRVMVGAMPSSKRTAPFGRLISGSV